jgi:lipopolysaccharide export system ATP-binding protein
MILSEHLIKKYKQRTVVNNVSFHVEQGEIVMLLGPLAGKTTSFYMIVGLIKPNEGKVFLDDWRLCRMRCTNVPNVDSYLAQEASVFRKLS